MTRGIRPLITGITIRQTGLSHRQTGGCKPSKSRFNPAHSGQKRVHHRDEIAHAGGPRILCGKTLRDLPRDRFILLKNSKMHPSQFLANIDRRRELLPRIAAGSVRTILVARSAKLRLPHVRNETKPLGARNFFSASGNRVFQQNRTLSDGQCYRPVCKEAVVTDRLINRAQT